MLTTLLVKVTLALALGIATAAIARHASAAVRHLVLAATFAALVAIPAAAWLLPPIAVQLPAAVAVAPAVSAAGARRPTVVDAANTSGAARAGRRSVDLVTLARGAWAAGALALALMLAVALARLARIRRTAIPWPEGQVLINRMIHEPVRNHVDIALHESLAAPVTCGIRHPVVLLPQAARSWSEQDLEHAFLHELEHIHRHDWVIQMAARALCAVYWFHPLVWIAWRQLCLESERACDDAVLARADGAAYAQQLVTLAQHVAAARTVPMLSMAGRSDLSVRVRALLDATLQRGRAGRQAVVLAVATLALVVAALSPLTAGADQSGNRPRNQGLQRDQPSGQSIVATALGAGLIDAVERNNIADLSELLAGGADVNAAVPGDGSALIAAARSNRLSIVTFLVERGADVNLAVEGDGNPLIVASEIGALPIVQYLLDHGADANAMVPGDESPLINASGTGRLDVVKLLVQRGANVNLGVWVDAYKGRQSGDPVFEREYRSPLGMAEQAGHRAVVDFLRANGAIQ